MTQYIDVVVTLKQTFKYDPDNYPNGWSLKAVVKSEEEMIKDDLEAFVGMVDDENIEVSVKITNDEETNRKE